MLKPLKDLLTYLQRNANSSNIFGLTTPTSTSTMGPNENPRIDETMIESEDLMLDDVDPLNDPLALDDCSGTDLNVSSASIGSEDDDGLSSGKIILVDVTTLKPKEHQEEIETDDDEDVVRKEDETVIADDSEEEVSAGDVSNVLADLGVEVELNGTGGSSTCETNEDGIVVIQRDSIQSISCHQLSSGATVENDLCPTPEDGPLEEEGEIVVKQILVDSVQYAEDVDVVPDSIEQRSVAVETTAEQIQEANGEEEEEASDGSDSGLGLEPSRNVAPCGTSTSSSTNNSSNNSPLQQPPIKSSLKRRSEPLNDNLSAQQQKEDGVSSEKRPKKGITFEGVTVYYFPRIQGFGCVPSQGGCTLGMEFQHVHSRRLTLSEHSAEQRKVHRQQNQELNPRSSSSEDTSSEEEPSESGSEAESESYGFLQPVSTRQRRALLKAAGVRKIDPTEKDDCREIRTSREVCGCTCRGFCDPNRCACSLAGIKCQVDRPNFPCGCTLEGCANTAGRVEFNPGRVRTHFLHTIMKLQMEADNRKALEAVSSPRTSNANASASDTNDSSSYVIGSEKNWSNGPVRLPPSMVGYGAGVHPGPSSAVMGDGIGAMHPVVGMHHHHPSDHLSHHQSAIGLQQQQRHEGLPHGTAGHLQHQQHHHLPSSASPYVNQHGTDPSHQNYLVSSNVSTSHMVGGAALPSASSESLDLHYPFQDYYGGMEGGSAAGQSGHIAEMPMHQRPSCSNTGPPLTLHAGMYYRTNYTGFEDGGTGTTANIDLYRQDAMLPLHVPNSSSSTVAHHHILTTGHDRPLPVGAYGNHHTPGNVSNLPEKGPDCANDQSSVPKVPQQCVSSAELSGTSESNFSCTRQSATMESFSSSLTVATPENCDLNVTVISDTSSSSHDTSGEVLFVESDDMPREEVGEIVDVDNEDDVVEVDEGAVRYNARNLQSRTNTQASSFIDLTAPQADNTERLEAINDLLENSRKSVSIVRRSIAAEEDDELRDFQHSPVDSPHVTVSYHEEDDEVVCVANVIRSLHPERAKEYGNDVSRRVENRAESRPLTNGATVNGRDEQQYIRQQKRLRCPTVGEESVGSVRKMLHNGSDTASSVSSYPLAGECVPAVSSSSGLVTTSVSSVPTTGALEPSENLCEIIKNSIVETAVSH
uniref:Cysteine/serine-rich nuclear protein N-terminal domain-containing protein n=1 Tax=Anopheles culicifacies TaxID=139723 RepID=A0A182LSC8_9DIPT